MKKKPDTATQEPESTCSILEHVAGEKQVCAFLAQSDAGRKSNVHILHNPVSGKPTERELMVNLVTTFLVEDGHE